MSIVNTTLRFFGEGLGQKLLDQRLIITANEKHPTAGYKNGFEGTYEGNAQQIGLLTGKDSQIIVIDFDDRERYSYLEDCADVVTGRGFHIYCQYDSKYEKASSPKGSKIDILSGNKPCYFAGANRTWKLRPEISELPSVDEILGILEEHGDPLTSREREDALVVFIDSTIDCMIDYSTSSPLVDLDSYKTRLEARPQRYTSEVRTAKFGRFTVDLDKTKIENNLVGKMKKTSEGKRNVNLYRYALEFARCELNMDRLEDAAVFGGQERKAVRATIEQAADDYAEDPGVSVLDRVRIWHEYASYGCNTDNQQSAVDWIAVHAVAQNDYRPLVSQLQLSKEIDVPQRGLSKTFVFALPKKGVVKVHKQQGQQANGHKHAHNYELCLDDVAVSEMFEQLDQLVAQSKSKPLEYEPAQVVPEPIKSASDPVRGSVEVMTEDELQAILDDFADEPEQTEITDEEHKEYLKQCPTYPIDIWVEKYRRSTPSW